MKLTDNISSILYRAAAVVLMALCVAAFARADEPDEMRPESLTAGTGEPAVTVDVGNRPVAEADSVVWNIPTGEFESYDVWVERDVEFNPSPNRAVWMSALFPGLGQAYNRRYWKLPIIVAGYLGLAYATSWNNSMLTDYQRAYRDIMDNDPNTDSYMNFFPPTVSESDLDKTWLTSLLKSRKDFYRRNRDLCIIGMVGVYLLAMVDAYVDASLSHFDITPDLSLDVTPTLIPDVRNKLPGVGMSWAFNF